MSANAGLEGARILVTGATGGLGPVLVRELAGAGALVTATYSRPAARDRADAVLGELPGVSLVEADLLDPAACDAATVEACDADGALAGLACLAGGFEASGAIDEAGAEALERMLAINLRTAWNSCAAALPALERGGGSLVLVGARAALEPFPGGAAYSVAKSAVLALVRALDAEWGGRGVRANAVLPGVIDTAANREAMPSADASAWTSARAVARTIAFLLSPASAAVRGAWVPVHAAAPD